MEGRAGELRTCDYVEVHLLPPSMARQVSALRKVQDLPGPIHKLNTRPGERLGFKTPGEVFYGI